jgi:hypothetical protein
MGHRLPLYRGPGYGIPPAFVAAAVGIDEGNHVFGLAVGVEPDDFIFLLVADPIEIRLLPENLAG